MIQFTFVKKIEKMMYWKYKKKKNNVDVYDPNKGAFANICPENLQHKNHGG
jgi:hypothetical protein